MKANEIKVGGVYVAKVNGKLTRVRVDAIRAACDYKGKASTRYDVTNLATGRRTTFRSAAKFRHPDTRAIEAANARAEAGYDRLAARFVGTEPLCEGCYKRPCVCLPDDCDPK